MIKYMTKVVDSCEGIRKVVKSLDDSSLSSSKAVVVLSEGNLMIRHSRKFSTVRSIC